MGVFEGKVVIVTGAGSGIGAATARRFAADGAAVVLSGRRRAKLEETAAGLDPARVLLWDGDVGEAANASAMVAATAARFGRLDVLVNNAGVATFGSFLDTPLDEWDRIMRIDVSGVVYATRAAMPHLLESKGNVVNVSSVSGLGGDWGLSFYNAAKGAVSNLTRALALEFGGRGVRVNAVAPSLTRSEMTADFTAKPDLMQKFAERLPLGRPAEPEEVASVIAFLSGPDASFVNGVVLPVDGGLSASNGQPNLMGA